MVHCEIVELPPRPAAVVTAEVPLDGLTDFFGGAFSTVMAAVAEQALAPAGPPFAYYPAAPTDVVQVTAGFPVTGTVSEAGEVRPFTLPGGRAVVAMHVGPYDALEATYHEMLGWVSEQGLVPAEGMWEEYLSDPGQEPDSAKWLTRVVWPLAET
jgi:effector-binding domain-containing protein